MDSLSEKLESLVDQSDLDSVVNALAEICYGKAEHLRLNWQDSESARPWDKAGRVLDRATLHIDV